MDWQEVAAIVAFVVLLLTIAGLIWRGGGTLSKTQEQTESNKNKLEANTIALTATNLKLDGLRNDFADYRVQAAKEFASIASISEIRREIQTGFHDVQSRLDRAFMVNAKAD